MRALPIKLIDVALRLEFNAFCNESTCSMEWEEEKTVRRHLQLKV